MNPDSDDETIQGELLSRKRKIEGDEGTFARIERPLPMLRNERFGKNPMVVMEREYEKETRGGAWKKGRDEEKEYAPGLRAAKPQLIEEEDLLREQHPCITMAGMGKKDEELFDEETHAKMNTNWARYQQIVRKAQEELEGEKETEWDGK
jgi:hypothetical protein